MELSPKLMAILFSGDASPLSSSSDFDDLAALGPSAASSGSPADDINVTPATTDEKQEMVTSQSISPATHTPLEQREIGPTAR